MEIIKYKGKLFDVVNRQVDQVIRLENKNIHLAFEYEVVRRGPGVRALIIKDREILLNYEYRYELNGWDYRLPGGKVFDSYSDYEYALKNCTIRDEISKKLSDEVREETDITVLKSSFLEVLKCGFTVDWDLYYYLIQEFEILPSFYNKSIQKTDYEFIKHEWIDYEKVLLMCLNGEISESRSAYILMKYIMQNSYFK